MCGRVNFGVDEWLFWTTRPQYECLKILSERPGIQLYMNENGIYFTACKRSLRRLCFYTCLSFCSQVGGCLPQCMLGYTPPGSRHPSAADTSLCSACWEIRATSRRYASYWNASLLKTKWVYSHVHSDLSKELCKCAFNFNINQKIQGWTSGHKFIIQTVFYTNMKQSRNCVFLSKKLGRQFFMWFHWWFCAIGRSRIFRRRVSKYCKRWIFCIF